MPSESNLQEENWLLSFSRKQILFDLHDSGLKKKSFCTSDTLYFHARTVCFLDRRRWRESDFFSSSPAENAVFQFSTPLRQTGRLSTCTDRPGLKGLKGRTEAGGLDLGGIFHDNKKRQVLNDPQC